MHKCYTTRKAGQIYQNYECESQSTVNCIFCNSHMHVIIFMYVKCIILCTLYLVYENKVQFSSVNNGTFKIIFSQCDNRHVGHRSYMIV